MIHEFSWSGWTPWEKLSAIDVSTLNPGPGNYVIAAARPLARAHGIDRYGLLTIGESSGLQQRIRDFIRCATREGQEGHIAGWRYNYFGFDSVFPFKSLLIRWQAAESKAEANKIEAQTMRSYLDDHFELPPLNYKFNWSGWDGENI
ncbi:MAG: hypothetical protein AAF797_16880 [Planctomycetota bacterium]